MATYDCLRRNKTYEKLKQMFKTLRKTLDPRLQTTTLSELGIDCTPVDLYRETEEGGTYFLPMSAARVDHLGLPEFSVNWDTLCPRFCIPNAMWLHYALLNHVTGLPDGSECSALRRTKWKVSR